MGSLNSKMEGKAQLYKYIQVLTKDNVYKYEQIKKELKSGKCLW